MKFQELAGKILIDFEHNDNGITLKFSDGTDAAWLVYGDCCSNTWIESVNDLSSLPSKFVGVEDSDKVPAAPDDPGGDCIKVYGASFKTLSGEIIVEYRNSSNGYYGGSLDRVR